MTEQDITERFSRIVDHLTEQSKRLWCANEALALGWGGITRVAKATGISRTTITVGIEELLGIRPLPDHGIRHPGGGRKKITETDPDWVEELHTLIEPLTRGDPESPLRWLSKSTRKLANTLTRHGHSVSHATMAQILHDEDYSLQANHKRDEGAKAHPDRDAQFQYIARKTAQFQAQEQPVISVDTKKKEHVGNYKHPGQEYRPKGFPREVNAYDFVGEQGKVAPYGIYDVTFNKGWVSVGVSHDTAEVAVNSIRTWWGQMGYRDYPRAYKMLLTADCGGRNGDRVRLWKWALQQFVNEIRRPIHVSHYPPGTSKWHKIEHRMFSAISANWRGQPLIDDDTILEFIRHTGTEEGLEIQAQRDPAFYATGRKISDTVMKQLNIHHYAFHGEWNYKISPQVS